MFNLTWFLVGILFGFVGAIYAGYELYKAKILKIDFKKEKKP